MLKVVFAGDVAFSEFLESSASKQVVDDTIMNFLDAADYVVANVETTIGPCTSAHKKIIDVISPPETADNLVRMHMNVWNLCNNHIDDCGDDGAKQTFNIAKDHGCTPLGIAEIGKEKNPSPLILEKDGCKVGIMTVCRCSGEAYLFNYNKRPLIQEQIRSMRSQVDYIVAISHMGREFSTMPTPEDKEQCRFLLDCGADIVVAHHPHVVQNYEKVGDKIIFYSLGNFIMDIEYQRRFKYTDVGMLLKFNFSKSGYQWEYLPTKLDRTREWVSAMDPKNPPANFRDIQPKDYRLLFPLAAKYLDKNEEKISAYVVEKTNTERDPDSEYRGMLRRKSRLSWLYRFSKHRQLYQYIINS